MPMTSVATAEYNQTKKWFGGFVYGVFLFVIILMLLNWLFHIIKADQSMDEAEDNIDMEFPASVWIWRLVAVIFFDFFWLKWRSPTANLHPLKSWNLTLFGNCYGNSV